MNDRQLISFYQASERLGVSYWTLWRGAEAGFFKTVYVGARRLIPQGEIKHSVAELRIPDAGPKRTVSGYFNDMSKMAVAAERWSGRVRGVYTTLNPVRPDLLARSANHVIEYARATTTDEDIVKRVWLPIDFDVVRPAGISSNNTEHEAALGKARLCRQFLREKGWPDPIYADSGNGGHLDYRIDLPTESPLVERVLKFLAGEFDGAGVHVDVAVHNPARIWKLYGTKVCKGDSTAERPHRVSTIIECPNPLVIVPAAQLENLIGPEAKAKPGRPYEVHREFSLEDWLAKYQDRLPPLGIKRPFDGNGWKREFDYCPWNRDHTTRSAFVGTKANGAIVAGCQHNSCQHKTWQDLKALVGDTVTGTWTAPTSTKSNGRAAAAAPAAPPMVWTEDDLTLKFTETYPDLRYVAPWGKWFRNESGGWRDDTILSVFDRARETCRGVSEGIDPKETATLRSLRAAKTRAAIENMARSDPRHAATVDQWDRNGWLLNTPGGTCELRTGTLREHRPGDYLTKMTAVTPIIADCTLWNRFLNRITAGDAELQRYLQRMAGYGLTGDISEHALFFLYGTGSNGKGVFTSTLHGILADYAQVAQMEVFTENKNDRHPTELAALRGARLVIASEIDAGRRMAEGRVKSLTGGDPIRARFCRCDEFEFRPTFKLMLAGNHKPALRSVDEAIRRRVHLAPFTVTIPPEERDLKLGDKLRAEWPQILQWAINGCLAWQREGLNPPKAVRDATEEYFATEDAVMTWVADRCIVSPQAGTTKTSALYADFKLWAEKTGEFCGSQKRFSQDLKDRGFIIRESHLKVIDGIALRSEDAA